MKNNRRNFLKTSSLGILSLAIPMPLFSSNNKLFSNNLGSYNEAKEIAKKAKKYFYKKEYLKAEGFYKKCIELAPSDIRYYDNLKAVYGAQGKYIDSLNLFKTALANNSQNLAFHDRTARSLMQLELGNKKMADLYKNGNNQSLLKEARKIYKEALKVKLKNKTNKLTIELIKNTKKRKRKKVYNIKKDLINIQFKN